MLRVLLSVPVRERLGEAIVARLGDTPHVLLSPAAPAAELEHIELAYLSRDVVGDSSKSASTPEMAAFYRILRRARGLKWLQIYSAGGDRPLYAELRERGVCITTAAGAASRVVAQSALAGMLALNRKLPYLWDAQRRKTWAMLSQVGWPAALEGQVAVVVGLGPIGLEIARLLRVLGLRVHGVRRSEAPAEECETTRSYERLDEILPLADWLILACPLSAATHRLLDEARLAAMKRGAMVVNVSRGEVIDEAAMAAALRSGQLGGAFLDVFVQEPLPPDSPLWPMEQVIISPHTASHSSATVARIDEIFLENLSRWLESRPMLNVLSAERPVLPA